MSATLRELRESDSNSFFKWINDPALLRLNSSYSPTSFAQHKAWFSSVGQKSDMRIFTIQNENSEPVGSCSLRNLDWVHRSAELQIRIGEACSRGKGLGRQAVSELLSFGFDDLNLNRIFLNVFRSNARARAVYEKSGFIVEGTLRHAYFIGGNWEDSILMSILRQEYKDRRDDG